MTYLDFAILVLIAGHVINQVFMTIMIGKIFKHVEWISYIHEVEDVSNTSYGG